VGHKKPPVFANPQNPLFGNCFLFLLQKLGFTSQKWILCVSDPVNTFKYISQWYSFSLFLALFKTKIRHFNEFRLYLNAYKTVQFCPITTALHTHNISPPFSIDGEFYRKGMSLRLINGVCRVNRDRDMKFLKIQPF